LIDVSDPQTEPWDRKGYKGKRGGEKERKKEIPLDAHPRNSIPMKTSSDTVWKPGEVGERGGGGGGEKEKNVGFLGLRPTLFNSIADSELPNSLGTV